MRNRMLVILAVAAMPALASDKAGRSLRCKGSV